MRLIGKIFVFLICIIFGILVASQGRTIYEHDVRKAKEQKSIEEMVSEVEVEAKENERLRVYLDSLQKENDDLIQSFAEDDASNALLDEIMRYKKIAGLLDVEGEGIVVTLDDAKQRKYVNPQSLIIHDIDILILLNELKIAGATDISVNGERILDISESVCAGPTILINKNRYATPFVISALGNKDTLYEHLLSTERYILMVEDGIQIDVVKQDKILIEGYKGRIDRLINGLEVKN